MTIHKPKILLIPFNDYDLNCFCAEPILGTTHSATKLFVKSSFLGNHAKKWARDNFLIFKLKESEWSEKVVAQEFRFARNEWNSGLFFLGNSICVILHVHHHMTFVSAWLVLTFDPIVKIPAFLSHLQSQQWVSRQNKTEKCHVDTFFFLSGKLDFLKRFKSLRSTFEHSLNVFFSSPEPHFFVKIKI